MKDGPGVTASLMEITHTSDMPQWGTQVAWQGPEAEQCLWNNKGSKGTRHKDQQNTGRKQHTRSDLISNLTPQPGALPGDMGL